LQWRKALVQAYSTTLGRHLLLYGNGEVEWLALSRGFYAWHVRIVCMMG